MSTLIAGLLVSLLKRLITEAFLAKLIIEALRAWSSQTENEYDDRLITAMAEALGVDSVALKVLASK